MSKAREMLKAMTSDFERFSEANRDRSTPPGNSCGYILSTDEMEPKVISKYHYGLIQLQKILE